MTCIEEPVMIGNFLLPPKREGSAVISWFVGISHGAIFRQ